MSQKMDIQELIEDHNECIYVDFKREPYHADNKPELIKDILAFANASYAGDRYIIIGVKKSHEKLEIFPVNNPEDPASIQQYIHDNVNPELIVTYTPYNYKGHNLMVITISNTNDQPYYPAKAINRGGKFFLKENDLWIRKGEHKVFGKREDLEKIYARKYAKNSLAGKIDLKFKDGSEALEIPVIRDLQWPTAVNKAEIEEQLEERSYLISQDPKLYTERYGEYNYVRDSQSYQAMDLPTLRQRLETVTRDFSEDDDHYLNEERAYHLQFLIANSGQEHLKDVLIEISFPTTGGLSIADHIYLNKYQRGGFSGTDHQAGYPVVVTQKDRIVIRQKLDEIRHKISTEIFSKPLRIVAMEAATGKNVNIAATIYASNLPEPQQFELTLTFK